MLDMVKNVEQWYTTSGSINWHDHFGKLIENIYLGWKNAYFLTRQSYSYVCTQWKWVSSNVETNVSSSIICISQKCESTQISINKKMDTYIMVCSYDVLYSNSKQKKRLLLHAIVQTNLTEIILSKRSQTRKSTYCMIPRIWSSKTSKTSLWG